MHDKNAANNWPMATFARKKIKICYKFDRIAYRWRAIIQ